MRSEKHPTLVLSVDEAQIFKCASPDTTCYRSRMRGHVGTEFCAHPGHELHEMVHSRDVSFVDFPDKFEYASTILGGMCLVDGILILSDATSIFTRLPTLELLTAASVLNKRAVLIQSLTDLTDDTRISEHHQEITQLIARTCLSEPLIIPVSALKNINIEALCKEINSMCMEEHDYQAPVKMLITDNCINDDKETGEVILTIYGRLLKGILKKNQQLEIRPGLVSLDENERPKCNPIIINVASLEPIEGNSQLEQTSAGVMVAVKSTIDYYRVGHIVTSMGGYVIGDINSLPDVFSALQVKIFILPLMFNSYTEEFDDVSKIKEDEKLLLTVGMLSAEARVRKVISDNAIVVSLTSPICARKGDKVFLLRPANVSWRLIGHGEIEDGKVIRIEEAIHG